MRASSRLAALAVVAAAACAETTPVKFAPPYIAASTTNVEFGSHVVGTETDASVFLINKGDEVLTVSDPTGDTAGGVFAFILPKSSIDPTEDATVKLVFVPTEAKEYRTTLTFKNNSQNEPNLQVTLHGVGVAPDPCLSVTCNSPPPPECITSTVSRRYDKVGTCANGECSYEPHEENCDQFGCDDASGLCAKDPCIGVSCDNPPNPCFFASGQCNHGACTYTANNGSICHDSNPCTINDTCIEGSCVGTPVVCNQAPDATCLDANTLRTWNPAGSCDSTGTCQYEHTDTSCAFGCVANACKGDPCAGGCDDGNPCTTDTCDRNSGCHHVNADGQACISGSSACPTGRCTAGSCLSVPDITCQKEVDTDLCGTTDIAGKCTAAGECVVNNPPPENTCSSCNSPTQLCVKCTPVPGFSLEICL